MRLMQVGRRCGAKLAAGAAMVPGLALATETGTDYTEITGAIDWAGVTSGILAIGAALAGVYVVSKGVSLLLRKIGR